jgi:hypothetical protein
MNQSDLELIEIYQQGINLSRNGKVNSIVDALELIVSEEMNGFGNSQNLERLNKEKERRI